MVYGCPIEKLLCVRGESLRLPVESCRFQPEVKSCSLSTIFNLKNQSCYMYVI